MTSFAGKLAKPDSRAYSFLTRLGYCRVQTPKLTRSHEDLDREKHYTSASSALRRRFTAILQRFFRVARVLVTAWPARIGGS